MARRPYGTGTIARLGPDRVRFRVYLKDPLTEKGRQVSKTVKVTSRTSNKDLEAQLRAFHAEVHQKQEAGTTAPFSRLLDEWLAELPRQRKSKSTIEAYTTYTEKRIRPALGKVRLDKLGAQHLDHFYGQLERDGLSPGTVQLIHSIIRSALSQGERWGWVGKNVARQARPPVTYRPDRPSLPLDDLRRLVEAADADTGDLAAAIVLAALTGARRGELCGLRWSDLDWDARTLRIERAWVPGKGGQHLSTVKTHKGRTVALDDFAVSVLELYRARKTAIWGELPPDAWLLSLGDGTEPLRAKTLTEYVATVGKRLDPPLMIHFHELRHFAVSESVAAGADPAGVAARMGHSVAVMAGTYLHVTEGRSVAAAEALGSVVARALTTPQSSHPPDTM